MRNKIKIFSLSAHRVFLAGLIFFCLSACAAGLVFHSFSFNAAIESPDVVVLDYRYGDSLQPSARVSDYDKANQRVRQGVAIGGDMLRGDSLYVKWQIKKSALTYEDTVALKRLLPRNIDHCTIHFTIKDQQLFVYLITTERLPAGETSNGPREYDYLKVITLSSNFGREVTN